MAVADAGTWQSTETIVFFGHATCGIYRRHRHFRKSLGDAHGRAPSVVHAGAHVFDFPTMESQVLGRRFL